MIRRGRLPLWNDLAGCGAPHLANGQSAVFDPFHAIAYLGTLPEAHAWMAAARLWVAGLGMFLLARRWGLGAWGRWFAGLAFPFCGFLVVWLLFPVTSVAVWMPWLFWASDRVLDRPGPRTVGGLALVGGAGLAGRARPDQRPRPARRGRVRRPGGSGRGGPRRAGRPRPGLGGVERGDRPGHCRGERRGDPAGGLPGAEPRLGRSRRASRARPWALDAAAAARRRLHGAALCVRQPAAGASQPGAGRRGPQPERVGRGVRRPGHAGLARAAGAGRRGGGSRGSRFLAGLAAVRARWARSASRPSTTCCGPCRSWT